MTAVSGPGESRKRAAERRHVPEAFTRPSATLFVVVGVVLVLGGGVGTVASLSITDRGWIAYLMAGVASVFTGAGGVVISWVSASLHERRNATQTLEAHMDSVSQNLTLAASQVDNVIRQVQNGEAAPEVGLALVDQAMLMISGQIRQLQILVGKPLDTQEQIDTRNKVRSLAAEIADSANSGDTVSTEKVAQLITLTEKLSAQAPQPRVAPTYPTSFGNINCPSCEAMNEVRVGDRKGDTKKVACQACGEVFNVHRGELGRLISRPIGYSTSAKHGGEASHRQYSEPCECGASLLVQYEAGDSRKLFFCGSCGRRFELDQRSGIAIVVDTWPVRPAVITGIRKSRPTTACPTCDRELVMIVPTPTGYSTACSIDKLVLAVSTTDFDEFREGEAA